MPLTQIPKVPTHHKKRTGQHQRRSKTFAKTYWPFIPLLSIAALIVIALGALAIGPAGAVMGTVTVGIAVAVLAL